VPEWATLWVMPVSEWATVSPESSPESSPEWATEWVPGSRQWASASAPSGTSSPVRVILGDGPPVSVPDRSIELMTRGFALMGSRSWFVSRAIIATIGVVLAAVLGLFMCAGARADVTINPNQAVQGTGTEVAFSIPDGHGKVYTTKIVIEFPADAPIGEVDPLSVDGWAPLVTYRTVAKPVQGLHGGASNQIPSAVTWSRAGAPANGNGVNKLSLGMGPLPFVARLPFTVVQTYSDKTVQRWNAPASSGASGSGGPVLTLTPAPAGNPTAAAGANGSASDPQGMAGMPGMEGMSGMGQPAPAQPAAAEPTSLVSSNSSGTLKSLDIALALGVLIVGLGGAVWLIAARTRRRTVGTANAPDAPA
jgi:uncharacterized protein YcnI